MAQLSIIVLKNEMPLHFIFSLVQPISQIKVVLEILLHSLQSLQKIQMIFVINLMSAETEKTVLLATVPQIYADTISGT